jgi:hypothetical protein
MWTFKDANALNYYRRHHVRCRLRELGSVITPYEDDIEFPVPDDSPPTVPKVYNLRYKLPFGHQKLPYLLWGKWATVWVRNARLSPADW